MSSQDKLPLSQGAQEALDIYWHLYERVTENGSYSQSMHQEPEAEETFPFEGHSLAREELDSDYAYQQPESTAPNLDISLAASVPSNTDWPGEYSFDICFGPQREKTTKSTAWTYSDIMHKLFINMDVACKIRFKVGKSPPKNSILRAMPIFTKGEHVQELVKRCPVHSVLTEPTNFDHPAPDHLVRCESSLAQYDENPLTKRLSVTVPFECPQAGSDCTEYLYKFMCFSSCASGLNRKPVQLIFTLESNNQVLGRRALNVRVCACPGRDRKTEEAQLKTDHTPKRCKKITKEVIAVGPPSKKLKNDDEVFSVEVHGRNNYEILCKFRDTLEKYNVTRKENPFEEHAAHPPLLVRVSSASAGPSGISLLQGAPSSTDGNTVNSATYLCRSSLKRPLIIRRIPSGIVSSATSNDHLRQTPPGASLVQQSSETLANRPRPMNNGVEDASCLHVKKEFRNVAGWLDSIGMSAYADMFANRGFQELQHLDNLTQGDLIQMRIGDAHRDALWKHLEEYLHEENGPSSQVSTTSQSSQTNSDQLCGSRRCYEIARYKLTKIVSFKSDHDYDYM